MKRLCYSRWGIAVAAATATLLVTAGCGGGGSGGSSSATSSTGSSTGASSATSPATTTPACPRSGAGPCLGKLAAGTYKTQQFQPPITYTVPAGGWSNEEDDPYGFSLAPPGVTIAQVNNAVNIILMWPGVEAGQLSCSGRPASSGPQTARGFVISFEHNKALRLSGVRPVVVGGLHGYVMTVQAASPHSGVTCGGFTYVPLINNIANPADQTGVGSNGDRSLFYFLGANPALCIVADSSGPHAPSLREEASVISHFHFSSAG